MKPLVVGLGVAGAISAFILWRFDPSLHSFYPQCPLRSATGLSCAGCGGLRSTHALLHGRVGEAFRWNPLWVLVVALLPVAIPLLRWRRKHGLGIPSASAWTWGGVGVLFTFTVLRNLPLGIP